MSVRYSRGSMADSFDPFPYMPDDLDEPTDDDEFDDFETIFGPNHLELDEPADDEELDPADRL